MKIAAYLGVLAGLAATAALLCGCGVLIHECEDGESRCIDAKTLDFCERGTDEYGRTNSPPSWHSHSC
jgi:hypothetical protein